MADDQPQPIELDNEDEFESWEEDIRIQRDEEGNILPVRHETLFGNPIIVYPIPRGVFNRTLKTDNMDSLQQAADDPEEFDTEVQLELLTEWYVRPDFSDLTEETLDNEFPQAKLNEYLQALLLVSGILKSEAETLEDSDIKNKTIPT